eukprot:241474-Chlamydomonas_euryale.AAC.1
MACGWGEHAHEGWRAGAVCMHSAHVSRLHAAHSARVYRLHAAHSAHVSRLHAAQALRCDHALGAQKLAMLCCFFSA